MEVDCLSVPNPRSYLICAGVQDVENRGFPTDFRGRLFIHSSGRSAIRGMPPLDGLPVPVIHEFNAMLDEIGSLHRENRYIGVEDAGVHVFLKDEDQQDPGVVNEYALLSTVYEQHRHDPLKPFFRVNAIIGHVDLVDVVRDSSSPWAEADYHHWILRNPVLFRDPIVPVRTTRTGLWKFDLPEE